MNQSVSNFYTHLVENGADPSNIETLDGAPDIGVGDDTYLVEKLYGGQIVLHSDRPVEYLESSHAEGRHLALMPDDPNESTEPVAVIPVEELLGAGAIPEGKVREHSKSGVGDSFSGTVDVTLAHRVGRIETVVQGDLAEQVAEIAKRDPAYDGEEQVVRAACRRFVKEQEEYGDAA